MGVRLKKEEAPEMRMTWMPLALLIATSSVAASDLEELTESRYSEAKGQKGILIVQVNWGRSWGCGGFENAQLQSLSFAQHPRTGPSAQDSSFELAPPSSLFVNDHFVPYAYIIKPGTYALTGFDVKVARSTTDVGHFKGTKDQLFAGGAPVGGAFTVHPGEAVYIGHIGLDCSQQPIPWRYYIEGRADFDRYVSGFRERFPFVEDVPVRFRLLETSSFGQPYALEEEPSNGE